MECFSVCLSHSYYIQVESRLNFRFVHALFMLKLGNALRFDFLNIYSDKIVSSTVLILFLDTVIHTQSRGFALIKWNVIDTA